MFCSQCGSQINDSSLFCSKCGARVAQAAAVQSQVQPQTQSTPVAPIQQQAPVQPQVQPVQQQAPVQPQVQPVQQQAPVQQQVPVQPQVVVQQQAPMQPQVQPVYVQPQVQPVQQQVPLQPQVVVQQQAPVQPQVQQVYVQPQPQPVPVQPQVVVQPQSVPVQPQEQPIPAAPVQPQPQVQAEGQGAGSTAEPKKKKKGIVGIVIGILAAAIIFVGIIVAVIASGVLKSPKKLFAENVVKVFENINGELPNIGMSPVESVLHLTVDDTNNSHTTTTTTSIQAAEAGEYEDLELVQSYSYDKEKGNAAYDFTITSSGTPVGSSGVYFNGNDFIFSPMGATYPMVRYQLDSDSVNNYKSLGAVDRYALMILGKSKEEEKDWKEVLKNFNLNAVSDIDKKQFEKSKEDAKILGEIKSCNVISVTVDNDQAMNLINGISDLIAAETENEEQKEQIDLFEDLCESYQQNGGNLELTVKTYSYKKKPVIVRLDADLSGEIYNYEISFYEKGKEKELYVSSTSDGETTIYADSVLSAGIGQYQYTTEYDNGGDSLLIEKKGYILGNNREVKGTITYTPEREEGSDIPLDEDGKITGTIEETVLMGNGMSVTTITSGSSVYTITTEVARGNLDMNKITPPEFIEGSGIDCASLEELKETIKIKEEEDIPAVNNSVVRLAEMYALIFRNGMMESLQ